MAQSERLSAPGRRPAPRAGNEDMAGPAPATLPPLKARFQPKRRGVKRAGALSSAMLVAAYAFAFWALSTAFSGNAQIREGYKYAVILTAVPFLLAAHGFALVRWGHLRRADAPPGLVHDVATDVAFSTWEILFCWLGISASLLFLYYTAPVDNLSEWSLRFFLVLIVFFGATAPKSLVFTFALLPFVVTLTAFAVAGHARDSDWSGVESVAMLSLAALDLGVACWAVRLALRHGVFQVSEFHMPLGAGVIGGYLAGVIRTKQKARADSGFDLELSCLRQFRVENLPKGEVLWHGRRKARGDLPGALHPDTSIPVVFPIPSDKRPTSMADYSDRVSWTLRAVASLPETNFSCAFVFPVAALAADPSLPVAAPLLHAHGARPPQPGPRGVEHPAGGVLFRFPAAWNSSTELLAAAHFLFSAQLIWMAAGHGVSWELWLMVATSLGLLAWVLSPWALSTEAWAHRGPFEVTTRILGIFRQRRTVETDQVEDIVPRVAQLRTGLMDALDYYYLELKQAGGKSLTVGRHIRERGEAERIAREMKQALGLG